MSTTTTIENRTFKGLRAVEEEVYNSVKLWIDALIKTDRHIYYSLFAFSCVIFHKANNYTTSQRNARGRKKAA